MKKFRGKSQEEGNSASAAITLLLLVMDIYHEVDGPIKKEDKSS